MPLAATPLGCFPFQPLQSRGKKTSCITHFIRDASLWEDEHDTYRISLFGIV